VMLTVEVIEWDKKKALVTDSPKLLAALKEKEMEKDWEYYLGRH